MNDWFNLFDWLIRIKSGKQVAYPKQSRSNFILASLRFQFLEISHKTRLHSLRILFQLRLTKYQLKTIECYSVRINFCYCSLECAHRKYFRLKCKIWHSRRRLFPTPKMAAATFTSLSINIDWRYFHDIFYVLWMPKICKFMAALPVRICVCVCIGLTTIYYFVRECKTVFLDDIQK